MDLDPRAIAGTAAKLAERFGDEAYFAALCVQAGVTRGAELPHRSLRILLAFERHGLLAGAIGAAAIRHGDRVGLIDELGEVTYKQLEQRSNALANAWRERGLAPGEGVAILVRNHRGFILSVFAAAKCGARIVLLNTSFAGPQIREVAGREGTDLLVYDDEYSGVLDGIEPPRGRFRAWADQPGDDTIAALIQGAGTAAPPRTGVTPQVVILTSGTTGMPKGAPRTEPRSLGLIGGMLSKVPFRSGDVTELCAPMFHALGFAHAIVAIVLGSTLVVRRRFDPSRTLESLERHRVSALIVVPVMLQRILDLGEQARRARDVSHLRIIFVGASQLGAELSKRAMTAFGPILYNLYGSTEVAYATIATPDDLAAEPGCVGKVVRGSVVKILDESGNEVPPGTTGQIFVGNVSQFEGYTGGGTKQSVKGLMSTGDLGHFDRERRLFIDGRADEMIVSGGENVFPGEVEELLARHEAIAEAAVIGVDDQDFGQRLKAFIVLRDGSQLDEDQVKYYVRQNLARYKVPREVVFVDQLPRNATGKIVKADLRAMPRRG